MLKIALFLMFKYEWRHTSLFKLVFVEHIPYPGVCQTLLDTVGKQR